MDVLPRGRVKRTRLSDQDNEPMSIDSDDDIQVLRHDDDFKNEVIRDLLDMQVDLSWSVLVKVDLREYVSVVGW